MQAAGCIKALSTIEKQAGLETFYNFKPKTNKTEKVNLSTGSQAPAWESFIQDKTQSYQIITFPSLSLGTSNEHNKQTYEHHNIISIQVSTDNPSVPSPE
jgi:hypothetical protein